MGAEDYKSTGIEYSFRHPETGKELYEIGKDSGFFVTDLTMGKGCECFKLIEIRTQKGEFAYSLQPISTGEVWGLFPMVHIH